MQNSRGNTMPRRSGTRKAEGALCLEGEVRGKGEGALCRAGARPAEGEWRHYYTTNYEIWSWKPTLWRTHYVRTGHEPTGKGENPRTTLEPAGKGKNLKTQLQPTGQGKDPRTKPQPKGQGKDPWEELQPVGKGENPWTNPRPATRVCRSTTIQPTGQGKYRRDKASAR